MGIKTFVLENSKTKKKRHSDVLAAVRAHLGDDSVKVVYDEKGKPSVEGGKSKHYISVTTTGSVMLCVLSDTPVGIDGEYMPRFENNPHKPDYTALAERFFTDDEAEFVRDGLGTEWERFARIWVRKEAYVKCVGKTLADFPNFSVIDGTKVAPKVNGIPIKKFNIKFDDCENYLFAIAGID